MEETNEASVFTPSARRTLLTLDVFLERDVLRTGLAADIAGTGSGGRSRGSPAAAAVECTVTQIACSIGPTLRHGLLITHALISHYCHCLPHVFPAAAHHARS